MIAVLDELVKKGKNPKATVLEAMKDSGRKAVGCFPIYVPEEIIYAAGLLPVGVWGGKTDIKLADKYLQSFCCSIMRANMEFGMKGTYDMLSAVVITAYCDTLRAVMVNWPYAVPNVKVVPFVYPQNRQGDSAFRYTLEIFDKFQSEMESISGKKVTAERLEEAFDLYEQWRALSQEFTTLAATHPVTINAKVRHYALRASYYMDKKTYTEKLMEVNQTLKLMPDEQVKFKVVVTGLLAEPEGFLDLFVANNISFVADDLAQESRQFRTPTRPEGTVYEKMAWRIMDLRGDTFFYEENKSRGRMLIDMVKESSADAVVVCLYKFCDPEEFDYPVYKKELEAAGIPILYLEIEQQMDSMEQLRTRIQTFTEIL